MRIAVTGAGGRLGGHVVRLLAQPSQEVVAVSRRPLPEQPGVTRAIADYADPVALRTALRGVDTLVLVSSDGPVAEVIVHHHNIIAAAAADAVSHIVALSSLDADLESPFCYAVANGYTERLLRTSGCAVSIARASLYADFFGALLLRACIGNQLRVPGNDGQVSLVSRADVGRCLVALATREPTGRTHDITGPAPLELSQLARILAERRRTPTVYVPIERQEFSAWLAAEGEDAWWTYAYTSLFDSIRDQRWAKTSDEITRLTGRVAEEPHRSLLAHEH